MGQGVPGEEATEKGPGVNYYPFHVGDYLSHTRHLTLMEDLAYRRILDWVYLHERPFNDSAANVARLIGMGEHIGPVETVLREFFSFVEGVGWVNSRATLVIEEFQAKKRQASKAGKASARARSTTVEQPMNQPKPKPEPKPKRENKDRSAPLFDQKSFDNEEPNQKSEPKSEQCRPDGLSDELWREWVQHRRAKRAPITARSMKLIVNEAARAGWTVEAALTETMLRGWSAFKAEWVIGKGKKTLHSFEQVDYTSGLSPDGAF